jgi:hypothetical protein
MPAAAAFERRHALHAVEQQTAKLRSAVVARRIGVAPESGELAIPAPANDVPAHARVAQCRLRRIQRTEPGVDVIRGRCRRCRGIEHGAWNGPHALHSGDEPANRLGLPGHGKALQHAGKW